MNSMGEEGEGEKEEEEEIAHKYMQRMKAVLYALEALCLTTPEKSSN